jgi:hypothetical protein
MIRLIDILKMQGVSLGRYKIHLATGGKTSPLEAYHQGKFKEWQEGQNAKNFKCETVIGLIHRGDDRWLFGGVYRILGVEPGAKIAFLYKTELLPGQDDLVGRVVVKFKREFRASYIWGEKYGEQLEVAQILELPLSIEEFGGYNKVCLKHTELRMIVQRREPSWRSALSGVGGVYLIMDVSTGKAYVGSACGIGGIWQRWCSYAETGHGGNAELIALLREKGSGYAENFRYSVLEIADLLDTDQVLTRESHWKDVLMSREFGYNYGTKVVGAGDG